MVRRAPSAASAGVKEAAFEDLGAEHLWLDVYDFNERAQAVYEAEGFVTERSRPATEAGCAEGTAYVMGIVKG